jgi:hypothetical protein
VLWIRIGFKGDPDPEPAFYHNVDQDPDGRSQTNADPDQILAGYSLERSYNVFFCFRNIGFDLIDEKQVFLSG